ncbi:MAG: LysR family transcriptional regulator [Kiloniellaceae bacterium]
MDFKNLRYFLGVFDAKSITKAAEQLSVAQPALGLQIRKLEEELGVELFYRHSRGVTPTEAGALLAKHARGLLLQFERAKQDLIDFGGKPHGRIAVGMTTTTGLVLAAELAERSREAYPEVTLTMSEGLSERLMEWVDSGQIDIALTYNPDAVTGLICEPLVTEALYFVQAGGGSPADEEPVALTEVLKHRLLLPSRPHLLRLLVDDAAKKSGAQPEIVFEVDSVAVLKELVQRGLGSTVLPYGAVLPAVEAGSLRARRIDEPRLDRTLYMAYSNKHPASKAFVTISRLITDVVLDLAESGVARWAPISKRAESGALL